ncbi:glycosyl transferase [Thalassobaculum fulvum]|uniref:Glycosyl transferase n=1 Tax=Thalassobaculum fulvum TaxID=1633335 RepID=A0A918XUM2_9PROT|nr:glycosyltransferase family 4 protein [Thalassobaculum fulvum]GHD55044.1 glycosyl transferase [Thalassobaculum fulvum]
MVDLPALAAPALAFLLACLGTRVLVGVLTRRAILDRPNERSSHSVPVPRGGGLAVVAAIAAGWIWLLAVDGAGHGAGDADPGADLWRRLVPLAAALALGAISFVDDLRSLGAGVRLGVQALAVAAGLWALDGRGALAAVAPAWIDLPLTALGWLWFVNLYNFMDGIDGITGTETVSIGVGLVGLALLGIAPASVAPVAALLVAAALGFLVWNWHPARIFLGDVGSVPLGYLLGFLLVGLAGTGIVGLAAALLLPLVYVVDATLTLGRRVARGENPAQAHREHVYQRAVIGGASHSAVCLRIAVANAALVALAWLAAPREPVIALAAGAVVVALLFVVLRPAPAPRRVKRA